MNKIKVVLVAPNMNPRVIELNNTYNDVSDMFGNNCLGIKYLRDDTILIFDDMCNCKNLKFNRCFGDNINLSGRVVILGSDRYILEEDVDNCWVTLTDKQIQMIFDKYKINIKCMFCKSEIKSSFKNNVLEYDCACGARVTVLQNGIQEWSAPLNLDYVDDFTIDEVGGEHSLGFGYAPDNVFCGECYKYTCLDCSMYEKPKSAF